MESNIKHLNKRSYFLQNRRNLLEIKYNENPLLLKLSNSNNHSQKKLNENNNNECFINYSDQYNNISNKINSNINKHNTVNFDHLNNNKSIISNCSTNNNNNNNGSFNSLDTFDKCPHEFTY